MDVDAFDEIAFGSGVDPESAPASALATTPWRNVVGSGIFECLSYGLWAVLITPPDLTLHNSSSTRNPHRGVLESAFTERGTYDVLNKRKV